LFAKEIYKQEEKKGSFEIEKKKNVKKKEII